MSNKSGLCIGQVGIYFYFYNLLLLLLLFVRLVTLLVLLHEVFIDSQISSVSIIFSPSVFLLDALISWPKKLNITFMVLFMLRSCMGENI